MNMKKFTTLATSVFVALLVSAFAFTVVGCGGDPEAGPAGSSGGAGASAPVDIDVTDPVVAQARIDMAIASGAKVFIPGGVAVAAGVIDLKTADVTLFAPLTFAGATSILNAASATVSFYSSASTITIGSGIFIAPAATPENWVGKITDPSSMLNLKTKDEVLEATGNTAVLGSTLSAISAEDLTAVGTKFSGNTLYIIGDGASIDIGSADVDLTNTKITTIGGAIAVQGVGTSTGLTIGTSNNDINLKLAGALSLTPGTGLKSLDLNGYALTLKGSDTTVAKVTGTGTIAGAATTELTALDTTSNITISGAGTALTVTNLGGGSVTLPGTLAGTLILGGTGTVGVTGGAVTPVGVITLLGGADITLATGTVITHSTVLKLGEGRYRANGDVTFTAGVIDTAGGAGKGLTVGSDSDYVRFASVGAAAAKFTPSVAFVTIDNTGIFVADTAILTLEATSSQAPELTVAGTSKIIAADAATLDAATDWLDLSNATLTAGAADDAEDITIAGATGVIEVKGDGNGGTQNIALHNGAEIHTKGLTAGITIGGTARVGVSTEAGSVLSFASTTGDLVIKSTTAILGFITVPASGNLTIGANTTIALAGTNSTAVGQVKLGRGASPGTITFTAPTSKITTSNTGNACLSGPQTNFVTTVNGADDKVVVSNFNDVQVDGSSTNYLAQIYGGAATGTIKASTNGAGDTCVFDATTATD
ncbi:MAG: hypothetical protein Ta2F_00960 [Termitinemataceae bacterium]|nr:MAG: hypothetical protein Ta2F_00960 [Termitinemataceae bacterium]